METLKKWGSVILAIAAVLGILWSLLRPVKTIETTKNSKAESVAWARVESLQAENMMLRMSKTEIEKKLAEQRELAKNVNIHREFYPDGKLKTEDIIDLSKYLRRSESLDTSTTTVTDFLSSVISDLLRSGGYARVAETNTTSKETQYARALGIDIAFNPLNLTEFGFGLSLRIVTDLEVHGILMQKELFKEIKPLILSSFYIW